MSPLYSPRTPHSLPRPPPRPPLFPYTTLFRSHASHWTPAAGRLGGHDLARARQGLLGLRHRVGGLPELEFRAGVDRKSTRLNSSHVASSYAVFCLNKKMNPKYR